jgi:hypothetical protein
MAVPTVVVVLFATLPPYYSIWIKRKDVGHSAGAVQCRFSTVGGAVQYSRGVPTGMAENVWAVILAAMEASAIEL